jgi:hypothetical protein
MSKISFPLVQAFISGIICKQHIIQLLKKGNKVFILFHSLSVPIDGRGYFVKGIVSRDLMRKKRPFDGLAIPHVPESTLLTGTWRLPEAWAPELERRTASEQFV